MSLTAETKENRIHVVLLIVLIISTVSVTYTVRDNWSTHKVRVVDDNNEPLFYANNTPAYENDTDAWSVLGGVGVVLLVSLTAGSAVIVAIDWRFCKGNFLFEREEEKKGGKGPRPTKRMKQ